MTLVERATRATRYGGQRCPEPPAASSAFVLGNSARLRQWAFHLLSGGRSRPASLPQLVMTASFSSVASAGAVALIILGAAPMAAAQANPVADPILAEAINGSSAPQASGCTAGLASSRRA